MLTMKRFQKEIYQSQERINLRDLRRKMINKIKELLSKNLNISELDILDESPNHGGYNGSVTHVKIIVISDDFTELKLLDRHKLVYKAMDTLVSQIHAISIIAKTPYEWSKSNDFQQSPPCGKQN